MQKALHMVAFIILVIGGLNWGLEIFNVGIARWIGIELVTKIIYALVALSAIYEVATHKSRCNGCAGDSASTASPGTNAGM